MVQEKILKYKEYEFVFVFTYNHPILSCTLYRKDTSWLEWKWNGELKADDKIEFELAYDNRVNIKGSFHLFHSDYTSDNYVFLNAHFGVVYEEHFEGNVIDIGEGNGHHHHHHDHPVNPVNPDDADQFSTSPQQEFIQPSDYRNLFPYLYLQNWPALLPQDQLYFVEYTATKNSTLYNALLPLKGQKDARQQMTDEALKYINGQSPYEGLFTGSTITLPFPLNLFPEIYNLLYKEQQKEERAAFADLIAAYLEEGQELNTFLQEPSYAQAISNIWQSVIALCIINGYNVFLLDQLMKILIVDNLIEKLYKQESEAAIIADLRLINAAVALPATLFPLPPYTATTPVPITPPVLYSGEIIPYAIGDLQMVQHCLKGYAPGEIAHIENVLIGEVKRSKNKKRQVIKELTTGEQDEKTQYKKDAAGEQIEQEVIKTLEGTVTDTYDYTNLQTSYGPPTTGTYNGKVTLTKDTDLKNENNILFARKILDRTIDRISSNVITKRSHSYMHETEEILLHELDNRNGNANIRGIYRWLNKVYKMRLVNYGHRFMIEFLVNKPSWVSTPEQPANLPFLPVAPDKRATPILSFNDITKDNYATLAAYYAVEHLVLPPVDTRLVTGTITMDNFLSPSILTIPEGYLPVSLTIMYKSSQDAVLSAGGTVIALPASTTVDSLLVTLPAPLADASYGETGFTLLLDTGVAVNNPPLETPVFYAGVTMACIPSANVIDAWKIDVYTSILRGYERLQQRYMQQLQHVQDNTPGLNRQTGKNAVRSTITNACFNVLWQYHQQLTGIAPEVPPAPTENNVNKPGYDQFFNTAFEWQELTFTLENQLQGNTQQELIDALSDQLYDQETALFLQAEKLRVIVPVKWEYNLQVLYYLDSGEIFYGKEHLTPVFDTNKSIAAMLIKLSHQKPQIATHEINTWEAVVPTQMQWLQDSSELPAFHSY